MKNRRRLVAVGGVVGVGLLFTIIVILTWIFLGAETGQDIAIVAAFFYVALLAYWAFQIWRVLRDRPKP